MQSLEIIESKHYKKNDTVEIDGKLFIQCIFEECTIRFGGDGFRFDGCDFVHVENIQFFGCANNTIKFIGFLRNTLNPNFFAPEPQSPSGTVH